MMRLFSVLCVFLSFCITTHCKSRRRALQSANFCDSAYRSLFMRWPFQMADCGKLIHIVVQRLTA